MKGIEEKTIVKHNFYPLFLIIGIILISSLLTSQDYLGSAFNFDLWMYHYMIGFFLVFGGFKLLDIEGFARGFKEYDLIAKKINLYGYVYPFIEVLLGFLLIVEYYTFYLLYLILFISLSSLLGVLFSLRHTKKVKCACLGTFINLPLSKFTLIESLVMVSMSVYMIFNIIN